MSGHPGIGPTSDHQYRTRCPDLRPPRRHRCPYGLTRLWAGNRSLPDRLLASQRISLRSIHFASMDKGLVATSPSSDGVKSILQLLPDAFEGSTDLSETVSRLVSDLRSALAIIKEHNSRIDDLQRIIAAAPPGTSTPLQRTTAASPSTASTLLMSTSPAVDSSTGLFGLAHTPPRERALPAPLLEG